MITHFHGMTRKAFEAFKAGKGKSELITPWSVSDNDGCMYFYSAAKIKNEYCNEGDTDEILQYGIDNAYSSGSIQAAMSGDNEVIVLCLNLSDVCYSDDYSCENMAYIADYANCDSVQMQHVIKAYSLPYVQYMAPFTIAGLLNNNYFNTYDVDPTLLKFAEQISKAGFHFDEVNETPEATEIII